MRDGTETRGVDLRGMTNEEIVEYVLRLDRPTQLELELGLRLETYVEIHGDYLHATGQELP